MEEQAFTPSSRHVIPGALATTKRVRVEVADASSLLKTRKDATRPQLNATPTTVRVIEVRFLVILNLQRSSVGPC
jgi:hypothetical protein